ncbi:hypothetical protein ANCCAN_09382 [Ancylostoma caninum]|uniref:Uncharacterized protein n=1 Tax=Ancylostoma caninum TaxID=29170 RepID=A0A368GJS8_ANCCA|nr:hypothetical protein ANCCAN_09382 [Ancylostoma caninum]
MMGRLSIVEQIEYPQANVTERLCEKTDLDSFKELVAMSTSLYYFFTFDPDYRNLEFASSALSSALQLMVNRSTTPAVELVDSILRFVNDPRVVV